MPDHDLMFVALPGNANCYLRRHVLRALHSVAILVATSWYASKPRNMSCYGTSGHVPVDAGRAFDIQQSADGQVCTPSRV